MSSEFRIRPIDSSHIGELIRLGEAANLSPWTAQNYIDELKNPDAVMLRLVSEQNEITGFIVGRCIKGVVELADDAEIFNIMVHDDHRRRGFAQALLDEFLDRCSDRKIANVWLEVRESNVAAINFYRKNGFEPVQTRKNFYRDPEENAILMRMRTSSCTGSPERSNA